LKTRALRRIFGPNREAMAEDSKKLHNLYPSLNSIRVIKSRRIKWAGHVASMGEITSVYKVYIQNAERMRPFRRPRYRWEDNIKMGLKQTGCESMNWIHLDREQW
jgi:hypothetical protein